MDSDFDCLDSDLDLDLDSLDSDLDLDSGVVDSTTTLVSHTLKWEEQDTYTDKKWQKDKLLRLLF